MEDLFLSLRGIIEKDLRSTGFNPDPEPPSEEPRFPRNLSKMETSAIKELYDNYLSWYEYLTDQLSQDQAFLTVAKARLDTKWAEATKRASKNKEATNADLRKAFIQTDLEYMGANQDYIYFKSKLAVQTERRDKIKRSADRIGRELWFRTQDEQPVEAPTYHRRPTYRKV
tara:strand:- start:1666 stop:2178 length:513 start_codon:yes stop_codon:yes gene_type:complete